MTVERIALDSITLSAECQPRGGIAQEVVDDYANLLSGGAELPPVTVFRDGGNSFLADGYHRHAASKQLGYLTIVADLREGTLRDAILFSLGANKEHGLRRTNADKRRVVERMLADEEWSRWSDRAIARHCGVSPSFVGAIREVQPTVHDGQLNKRIGLDGRSRSMPTATVHDGQLVPNGNAGCTPTTNGTQLGGWAGIDPDVRTYLSANLPDIAADQAELTALAAMPAYQQREAVEMVIGGGADSIADAKRYLIGSDDAAAPVTEAAQPEPPATCKTPDRLVSLKTQIEALDFDDFDLLTEWFERHLAERRAARAPVLRLVQ